LYVHVVPAPAVELLGCVRLRVGGKHVAAVQVQIRGTAALYVHTHALITHSVIVAFFAVQVRNARRQPAAVATSLRGACAAVAPGAARTSADLSMPESPAPPPGRGGAALADFVELLPPESTRNVIVPLATAAAADGDADLTAAALGLFWASPCDAAADVRYGVLSRAAAPAFPAPAADPASTHTASARSLDGTLSVVAAFADTDARAALPVLRFHPLRITTHGPAAARPGGCEMAVVIAKLPAGGSGDSGGDGGAAEVVHADAAPSAGGPCHTRAAKGVGSASVRPGAVAIKGKTRFDVSWSSGPSRSSPAPASTTGAAAAAAAHDSVAVCFVEAGTYSIQVCSDPPVLNNLVPATLKLFPPHTPTSHHHHRSSRGPPWQSPGTCSATSSRPPCRCSQSRNDWPVPYMLQCTLKLK